MSDLFIKICGVTNAADAAAAVELGADAIGLNFYRGSARCVTPQAAQQIVAQLPKPVLVVGVFVDEERRQIEDIRKAVPLGAVQFHGNESAAACSGWPCRTIKALRLRDHSSALQASEYRVDFILVDAYVEGEFGGSGKKIAIEYIGELERRRLLLAGGLTPENVSESVRLVRPFGVDVASGVESAPGKKDRDRMRRFIENARAA